MRDLIFNPMENQLRPISIFLGVSVVQPAWGLPISPAVIGDGMELLFLGLFMAMGMGAILVACVRCRRKKRGFQEFKNDNGVKAAAANTLTNTVEAIRSEFPIFQALSTPSSPQFQQLGSESSKNSSEALDYAEILNESTQPARRKLVYAENVNGGNGSQREEAENYCQQVPNLVVEEEEKNEVDDQITNANGMNESVDIDTIIINMDHEDVMPNDDRQEIIVTSQRENITIVIDNEMHNNKAIDSLWQHRDDLIPEEIKPTPQPLPVCDVTVESAEEVAPTNQDKLDNYEESIEEALRELDIAIGDDEDAAGDDSIITVEGDETKMGLPSQEMDDATFENVILRQLFVNNLRSGLEAAAPHEESCSESTLSPADKDDVSEIMVEAKRFVDSLLDECCERIDANPKLIAENTPPVQLQDANQPTTALLHTEDLLAEDCFFKNLPQICHSTPSVAKTNGTFKDANRDEITTSNFAPKSLFDGDLTRTFINTDANATFDLECKEITFNVAEGGKDATFAFDTVDRMKDAASVKSEDDLKPQTPLNTPIEVNLDKADMVQDDDDEYANVNINNSLLTTPASCTGWFLHPRPNETFELDGTFDVNEFPPPPPPEDLDLLRHDPRNYYGDGDDDGEEEDGEGGCNEDMNLTFDALRKQLAVMLPHAQGGMPLEGGAENMDDNEANNDGDGNQQMNMIEALLNHIDPLEGTSSAQGNNNALNFKRSLSPIMEESEEETMTMKTFVLNETRNMDSTSTGCIETLGEAAPSGLTKTALTASNDTLFNFEDTLGDRDEMVPTPTNVTQVLGSTAATTSNNNDTFIVDDSASDNTFVLSSSKAIPPKTLPPLNLSATDVAPANSGGITDILSPEQQKTFSEEEIMSMEHVSGSDASGNVDLDGTYTTNTIEMETCISLNKDEDDDDDCVGDVEGADMDDMDDDDSESEDDNDDVDESESGGMIINEDFKGQDQISEISEPEWPSSMNTRSINKANNDGNTGDCNSLCDVSELDMEKQNPRAATDGVMENKLYDQSDESGWSNVKISARSGTTITISTTKQSADVIAEDSNGNDKRVKEEEDAVPYDGIHMIKEKQMEPNEFYEIGNDNDGLVYVARRPYLSGEEDPWASSPVGQHNVDVLTSYSDWNDQGLDAGDSDNNNNRSGGRCDEYNNDNAEEEEDDDDDSSEEFMYVKGLSLPQHDVIFERDNEGGLPAEDEEGASNNSSSAVVAANWLSHVDQIPIVQNSNLSYTVAKGDQISSGQDLVSENEEGAVAAVGAQSAETGSEGEEEFIPSCWNSMAQPQRSALKNPDKSSSSKRQGRSVAFKKQHYHSVYEYPREVIPLSPSYSEPNFRTNYTRESVGEATDTVADINGFMISSSSRPFQNNQFLAQCNTWPTDGDFSWSQHQFDEGGGDQSNVVAFSEVPIEWPKPVIIDDTYDSDSEEIDDNNRHRLDSGVGGESTELTSESLSLGELCHTKPTLRLPLAVVGAPSQRTIDIVVTEDGDTNAVGLDTSILPTPSCTGSMDSLSSNSCSERQSMTGTFGKVTPQSSFDENSRNGGDGELEVVNGSGIGLDITTRIMNNDGAAGLKSDDLHRSSRISDSTDEDSGIENFTRLIK